MALDLPTTLSPSKVSAFTDCALAFRFSAINRIPQPPTIATVKGTFVHSTLERLLALPADARDLDAAFDCQRTARTELVDDPEWIELALDDDAIAQFDRDADELLRRYFTIEDPRAVEPVGLEMHVEYHLDDIHLRGIIDRLETGPDGELIISDYKTGKAPPPAYQQSRFTGLHFYAYLCEKVVGRAPAKVQLLFLGTPAIVEAASTEQTRRQTERKLRSIWQAIETACEREDFRPKKSKLCDWCTYREWCPAFGGDPAAAPVFPTQGRADGTTPPLP